MKSKNKILLSQVKVSIRKAQSSMLDKDLEISITVLLIFRSQKEKGLRHLTKIVVQLQVKDNQDNLRKLSVETL